MCNAEYPLGFDDFVESIIEVSFTFVQKSRIVEEKNRNGWEVTSTSNISTNEINKIESYKIDTTTESVFWADGWNFLDPFYNKLGVTVYTYERKKLHLFLGYCSIQYDKSFSVFTPKQMAEIFKSDFDKRHGSLERNDVYSIYCLVFENGVLKSKEKLVKK